MYQRVEYNDVCVLFDVYEHPCEIMLDTGYQGAQEFLRGINPINNQAGSTVYQEDICFHEKVSADRIIFENLFGWLSLLHGVMGSKSKWAECYYDQKKSSLCSLCKHICAIHSIARC